MPLHDAIQRRRQLEAASDAELRSHMIPGRLYQVAGETDRVVRLTPQGEFQEIAVEQVPSAPGR